MASKPKIKPTIEDLKHDLDYCRPVCARCSGTGWLDPIGPCVDGSYITSRPCPRCGGDRVFVVSEPKGRKRHAK